MGFRNLTEFQPPPPKKNHAFLETSADTVSSVECKKKGGGVVLIRLPTLSVHDLSESKTRFALNLPT